MSLGGSAETRLIQGKRMLVLDGGVSDRTLAALESRAYDGITIKYGEFGDFSWLVPYRDRIRELVFMQPVEDAEFVNELSLLEKLSICEKRAALRLASFPRLHDLQICWNKKYPVSSVPTLEILSIESWPYRDLTQLDSFPNLRKCHIEKGHLQSLGGIERLSLLRNLDIRYCRGLTDVNDMADSAVEVVALYNLPALTSIALLATAKNLREITLDRLPQVSDWSALFGLRTLRALTIKELGNEADGSSLCLDGTPDIEWLTLTNIVKDPDWEHILSQPKLKDLWLGYVAAEDPMGMIESIAAKYGKRVSYLSGAYKRKGKSYLDLKLMLPE